jgi:Ca2+-binding RTX toxin-like protein
MADEEGNNFSQTLTSSNTTNDRLWGAGGNDTIYGGTATGSGGGNDLLDGGTGNDQLFGGTGNDTLIGGSDTNSDTLDGGAGTDTADYSQYLTNLTGGSGITFAANNTPVNVNLETGVATGQGTDTLVSIENVIGGGGADTITGNAGANVLNGGGGNDILNGGAGNDWINGGAGDDTIDAGTGSDTVEGGDGNDLIYGGSTGPVGTTYITNGTFTGGGSGWTGTDLEFNPETSYGTGGPATNGVAELDGNAGQITQMNQSFTVDGAVSAELTFRGVVRADGGDVGTDGYTVTILDASGNVVGDPITVLPGTTWQDYSFNINFPAAGTYTLRFTEVGNNESLGALVDDVQITSTSVIEDSADTLSGGDGTDTIFGGGGNDLLLGGSGNDLIEGDDGDDRIQTGADNDIARGEAGNDTILGEGGDDQLFGGEGNDSLDGGTGNDVLFGGIGNDIIDGGSGDDIIRGGSGNDTVYGGIGNDTFIVGLNDVNTVSGGDVDDELIVPPYEVIYGGGGGVNAPDDNDTIDLSAFGFSRVVIVRDSNDPMNDDYENGYIKILDTNGTEIGRIDFFNIENIFPCFTPGTLIATARGDVPVEALVPGDLVLTRDNGLQPLRWVGRRDLSLLDLMADPNLQPVRIEPDALDGAGPDRPMLVSPQHRLLVEGARAELLFGEAEVLVAAKHLLGQAGVSRVLPTDGISYIHILFDQHEIVQSDGIWTESFQPAERMLSAMEAEVRAEVLALFPALAQAKGQVTSARPSLKAHEARVLLAG